MPTDTCPEDDCGVEHEFSADSLGESFECDCGSILRVGRSNAGALKLVHHPVNDVDEE